MWSLSKPPILNWLTISFFKYKKKKLLTKIWPILVRKLLVSEKSSIYLLLIKNFFLSILSKLKIKYENFFINFFFNSLIFQTNKIDVYNTTNIHLFFFLKQYILDYSSFFWRWDLSFNRTKYFFLAKTKLWNPGMDFFFLKKFLLITTKKIFDKNFMLLKNINNIFFFNSFFFTLILNLGQIKKNFLISDLKKIFYFGLNFTENIFYNIHDLIISDYNRFLTLQTGTLKISKYFVNRNYLFAVSTQLFKARKNFFLKFFFKNNWFNIFSRYKKYKWQNTKKNIKESIHIWSRSTTILPFFINKIFFIHNGNKFFWIRILPGMVGYKLGQFSFTRKIHTWGINLKNYFKGVSF